MEFQNNEQPKVSVIVPVYNAVDYIEECVDSILTQTFSNFELILIDDGSADDSLKICQQYARSDQRVQTIHRENSGPSKTRNFGLDIARGEYVVFCDSDDFYENNALELMLDTIENYNVDLVLSGFRHFFDDGATLPRQRELTGFSISIMKSRAELAKLYTKAKTNLFGVSIWAKMYRTDLIRENGIKFPEDVNYEEDCCFNLQYFRHVKTAGVCKDILYNYRQRQTSLSKGYRNNAFPFLINGFLLRKEFLIEMGMEEEIQSLYDIFLTVIIAHFQKIFFSSLKYNERLVEYRRIMDYPEVQNVVNKVKLSKKRLTRWLTIAARRKNPRRVEVVLAFNRFARKNKSMLKR